MNNQQPQPNQKKNQAVWIILIVVVLAVAVYGIWTAMSNENSNTNTANQNASLNENINAVMNENTNTNENINANTNSAVIDISDWEKYTNEEYGFEFKYPSDWNYQKGNVPDYSNATATIEYPILLREMLGSAEPPYDGLVESEPGFRIDVVVMDNKNNSTLNQYLDSDEASKGNVDNEENLLVDGKEVYKREVTNGSDKFIEAYIVSNQRVYKITNIVWKANEQESKNIFDKIVESLKLR